MTLFRTIVILVGALAVMLAVVILRAETTRLHYAIATAQRDEEGFRQRLRVVESERARLRNPMLIRELREAAIRRMLEEASPEPPAPRKRERR